MVQCVHYLLFSYIDCKLSLTHSLWNLTPIFSPLFFVYTQHSFASMIYRKCLRVRRDFMLYAHHYLSQCYRSLLRATSLKWNEMRFHCSPNFANTLWKWFWQMCMCAFAVRCTYAVWNIWKKEAKIWRVKCVVCMYTNALRTQMLTALASRTKIAAAAAFILQLWMRIDVCMSVSVCMCICLCV